MFGLFGHWVIEIYLEFGVWNLEIPYARLIPPFHLSNIPI
jgi:hypothetical protein